MMKITIQDGCDVDDIEVVIRCRHVGGEALRVASSLASMELKLFGEMGGQTHILEAERILYIETVDRKTFAYTAEGQYEMRQKLYELEALLSGEDFIRAGKSSLVNFSCVKSLRGDLGGRLSLTLSNGEALSVSRQYALAIKEKLGMKGGKREEK